MRHAGHMANPSATLDDRRIPAQSNDSKECMRNTGDISCHGKLASNKSKWEVDAMFRAAKRQQQKEINQLKQEGKWQ